MRFSMVASRFIYRPSRITPPKFCANPRAVVLACTSAKSNLGCWARAGTIASMLSAAIFFILDFLSLSLPDLQLDGPRHRVYIGIIVFINTRLKCFRSDRIFGAQSIVHRNRVAGGDGVEVQNGLGRR